jgi:BMFP domain-containing protein YqiC
MQDEDKILNELNRLHEKVDQMAGMLTELVGAKKRKAEARKQQTKLPPLTQEETTALQTKFNQMYGRWLEGQETAVREELEAISAEDIRRLADANNLNVTAKMSKDRVMQLIGFRFREKKQLTHQIVKPS